jgi:hypothetical protein
MIVALSGCSLNKKKWIDYKFTPEDYVASEY